MSNSIDTLQAEYKRKCAERDRVKALVEPLLAKREKASLRSEAARLEAQAISAQISEARGGEKWIVLKREIGALANAIMALKRAR